MRCVFKYQICSQANQIWINEIKSFWVLYNVHGCWMMQHHCPLPARQAAEDRDSRETSFATSVFLIHTSWYKLLVGHNKSLESELSKCCPSATDCSMITRTKAAQHCSDQETSFSIWRFCYFNSNFLFSWLSNILIFRALSHRVGLSLFFIEIVNKIDEGPYIITPFTRSIMQ